MSAGPYIVTQQRYRVEHDALCDWRNQMEPVCNCGAAFRDPEVVSRVAVATLGYTELRRALGLNEIKGAVLADIRLKHAATLPDGTRIEVEATTYEKLYDALTPEQRPGLRAGSGIDCTIWLNGGVADYRWGLKILAAWNAEYGIGIGARA